MRSHSFGDMANLCAADAAPDVEAMMGVERSPDMWDDVDPVNVCLPTSAGP